MDDIAQDSRFCFEVKAGVTGGLTLKAVNISTSNYPFLLRSGRPRPTKSLDTSCSDGDPVNVSLGSAEAWTETQELRELVLEAIRVGNVRRLGDLVSTNREAVLRMPELHEYLEHLRRRGDRAWDRIVGTPGARGRPRVDNIGLVLRVEKCMDEFELDSVAKAAKRLAGVLHLDPRSIQNKYSKYAPLVQKMLAGYAAEAGTMTENPYRALFCRPD